MNHPKIKLAFNEKLDQDMAWYFFNNQKFGGCDFWKSRALKHHPMLSEIESAEDKKQYLDNYISNFYSANIEQIKLLSNKAGEYIKEKQEEYFLLVDKIFNNYPWPKNELTGIFSIFDFCPRFLEDAGFQIFVYDNKEFQLFTISHECLHFIFYDFAQKNFPGTLGKMDTNTGKFWDIAEVFNAVIQDADDFIKLHGKINNIGYPNHKDLIIKGSLIWKERQDVYYWIENMNRIVNISV